MYLKYEWNIYKQFTIVMPPEHSLRIYILCKGLVTFAFVTLSDKICNRGKITNITVFHSSKTRGA